jgi:putative endonuclease
MGIISKEIGDEGEDFACDYLSGKGFTIIERNYRSRHGEVDLIARDGEFLVFVEVKNYSWRSYGSPLSAISRDKKRALIHAAETYLYRNRIKNTYCRFDVLAIFTHNDGTQTIDHYRDAFYVN